MWEAFSEPGNRGRTLALLVIGGLLGLAAGLVGMDDNPPGILLAYLSASALVLAVAHPWRVVRQFRRLLIASVLAFIGFVILHNVLEALASNFDGFAHDLLGMAGGVMFFAATLLCPPGVLVGAVGALMTSRRDHRSLAG